MRIGKFIEISPFKKKIGKLMGSAVNDHFLLCNYSPMFNSFSVLTKEVERKSLNIEI